jgi:hypothetical protein
VTECDLRRCYWRMLTATPIPACTPSSPPLAHTLDMTASPGTRDWPDSMLIDCLVRSAELGATDRLMIGGDVARRTRYVAYGGRPGLAYVGRRVVPRLVQAGYEDLVEAVLVRNPARYLSTASRSANRTLPKERDRGVGDPRCSPW